MVPRHLEPGKDFELQKVLYRGIDCDIGRTLIASLSPSLSLWADYVIRYVL